MALLKLERRRSEAALTPDQQQFALGTRSLPDLISPAATEMGRDYLRLDYQYTRTLVVHGYPRTVSAGWLSPLIDFEAPLDLSIHIDPMETGEVVRSLTHKLVQLHSSRLLAERGGRLADPEREVAYQDAEKLRDALQRGDERVFSVALYIAVRANSLAALDDVTRRVEITLDAMLAQSRVAILEQDLGFRSCLPQGLDLLRVRRNLDTSSLATTFPFSSSSLSMERGVMFGVAKHNHSPVIFDPFDPGLENANGVVVAVSGAGKSYATKLIALRTLPSGIDCIVIDPEDEYRPLCEAAERDGQYIRLASSSAQHLNPFDLPPLDKDADGHDPLAEQVTELVRLLEVMLAPTGSSFTPHERAVLDRALYQTYAGAGITADPSTHRRQVPIMRDLAQTLGDMPGEGAADLGFRLRRYTEGSLAGIFSARTNVALDRRLIVFNTQSLEEELQPLGTHLIANFVWTQVRRQRKPRLLLLDEAWKLMRFPEGGAFIASLARRARKYHLGLFAITQDASDFLGSEHGRIVLANASIKLLLKQDSSTVDSVVHAFRLSNDERQFLLGAGKGQGLFFCRGSHVALQIEASPAEHRLVTTAPHELAEMRATREPQQAQRGAA